ncbi:protein of unknown function DUF190 [Methanospirillum hungatei JF-1]|jgi:PII-like signaling protein|uniref:Uncharacterized protein n=1 Tax=Methanospirillum hungatei JF-1 (strain ATCC 27890 / DSM 864 / NBRC 100397 / JF-1) TaxID=323259 RepID=Q2FLB6_METHJ|nr:DUF190 domain-containing protein [Methanospirillum hungatei]ABD40849.1 protein of unknown function DUF190 [Methanospirillum hungatei JF-1]OQA53431.1 MAG: hypothetical protein BWY45_03031 [Euryarchaeota archaeon ADurb.Bin294]
MLSDGMLLRIYIAESAKIGKKPAYRHLVEMFQKRGFPGCTVFRGMVGYGHEQVIHTVDVLNFSMDLPVVIDVVDTKERVMSIVDEVEELVEHGLVITHDVKMGRKQK